MMPLTPTTEAEFRFAGALSKPHFGNEANSAPGEQKNKEGATSLPITKSISFVYSLRVAILMLTFHPFLSWALSDEEFRSDPDILWFGEEYLPAHLLSHNVVEDAEIHRTALQDVQTRERLFKVVAKLSENGKGEKRGAFETAVASVALGRPKEAVTIFAPLLDRFPPNRN